MTIHIALKVKWYAMFLLQRSFISYKTHTRTHTHSSHWHMHPWACVCTHVQVWLQIFQWLSSQWCQAESCLIVSWWPPPLFMHIVCCGQQKAYAYTHWVSMFCNWQRPLWSKSLTNWPSVVHECSLLSIYTCRGDLALLWIFNCNKHA